MPDPGFTRPDLCSIRAAAEQEELAEAVRGGFSADGYPLGDDDPPAPLTSGIDRAIRLSTAVAVLAVAGRAAAVSYWHACAVVRAHGGARKPSAPARARHDRRPGLRQLNGGAVRGTAPGAGTLPGPVAARAGDRGDPHGEHGPGLVPRPVGAVVAAWPAVSLVGSYELLVWLIRTSGAVERGPSAEHPCNRAACRTAVRSLPISAVDGDRPGGSERHASDPTRRPAGQAARLPAVPANEQRDDEVPEASTVNDAAVAAYRLSVQAGNPLSKRRLAHMFGRTSRRWARRESLTHDKHLDPRTAGHPGHGLTEGVGGRTRSNDPAG